MRVLLLEETADGLLDLAIRGQVLGHQIRYHVGSYDQHRHPTGRGLIERVPDWHSSIPWADLIIAGGNGKWLRELDSVRQRGTLMIGGHYDASQWELDRMIGMAAFKKGGIPTPPYRQCMNLDEAIACVADVNEGFACKPCGSVGDKSLSFVGKTAEETIWRLKRWKRSGKQFPGGLMVQKLVKGVEFAVGAWVNHNGFVDGIEENFETKRMFAGDLGPNTGEMGTVMRLVRQSKLFEKVLKPLEDRIASMGYTGNIDVNCIIDEDGTPHPLEWTSRLGWPSTNIELALHKSDPIEFLACVASGDTPPARQFNTVAVGVVMALPPYPFGHERVEEVVGVPVWGITPSIEDNIHFADVMIGEAPSVGKNNTGREPHLTTAGSYVLVATGTAETVVGARREAHRVLERIRIPASPFWRNDIGSRLRSEIPKLQKFDFARGLNYA
jgi:phosphoribosylamine---glycine ligase